MIGIELRDEEYNELIDYAKEIVEEADEVKSKACMLIKRLAMIEPDEDEEDEEYEEPVVYKNGGSGSNAAYRKSKIRRMLKRMK